jgi:hypothetical protein
MTEELKEDAAARNEYKKFQGGSTEFDKDDEEEVLEKFFKYK